MTSTVCDRPLLGVELVACHKDLRGVMSVMIMRSCRRKLDGSKQALCINTWQELAGRSSKKSPWFAAEVPSGDVSHDPVRWRRRRMDLVQMGAAHKHLAGVWSTSPSGWPLWFATEATRSDVSHDPVRWCRGRKGQSPNGHCTSTSGRCWPTTPPGWQLRFAAEASRSDVSHDPVRWCRRRMAVVSTGCCTQPRR
jgi:hypothetical protein